MLKLSKAKGKKTASKFKSPIQWRYVSPFSLLPRFCTTPLPLFLSSKHSHQSTNNSPLNFIPLLKHCRSIQHLKPFKSLLIVHGLTENKLFLGEFFKSCFHLGAPGLALSAFQTIKQPCIFLQNLIVRNLCNYGLYEDLLCLYTKCHVSGCSSDDFTFPFVIKACSSLRAIGIGREIHCAVLKTGYDKNLVIQTALVDFYAKNGDMETARVLFDRIPQPDLVSWNALIAGYSSNGLHQEVFENFGRALETGLKPNVSTLASVIPMCTCLGLFNFGKSLHGFIVKSGYMFDLFLVPALISMYTGDFDLSTARKLFDSVVEKNVTVWNAMISAYTQTKRLFEAFEMFREVVRAQLKLDLVTFVSIVPSCEDYSCINYGESLHACAIKHGLEKQLSVSTAFLSMYMKSGNFDSAKFLFDQIPIRNLLSWNAMISGCSSNGIWVASLAVFREMQIEGFNPDAVSLISVISACSRLEVILLGKSAHAFSLRNALDSNIDVSNALLMFYSDCGQLAYSFKLFYRMPIRNVVSWNTLISGCLHSGKTEEAIILLEQMQKEGAELDVVTLVSIIPCFNESRNLKQGMAIHGYAVKTGYASDVSLTNALITMYCNCGNLNDARLLFEVMNERNLVSWNSLMTGCRYYNLQNEVLVLFREMRRKGQGPNHVSLLNLLPLCRTEAQGKSIHAFAIRAGFVQEAPLLSSLIFMYNRFENTKLSLLIFQIGDKRDISLWNAIMSVHIQIKNAKQVVAFFNDLLLMDLEPDKVTVITLISACVQLNSLNLAHSVMAWVMQKGFDKDVAVSNALIDLYVRCGNISFAVKLFESLFEKDPVSWGIMINGYGLHGDVEAALDLFVQMQLSGLRPNEIIYSSVLSACSHAGLVGQSQLVFNSMVGHGISPKMEHYACIVDLLGRAGYLNEAFDKVQQLPFKPSVSLLESLLGACRIHGNVELGEKISEMLSEMDPENSGSYVMLHNIYASAGRWEDANKVRSEIEQKRLKKMRGFSLVGDGQFP